jgi:hypothetical protein
MTVKSTIRQSVTYHPMGMALCPADGSCLDRSLRTASSY